MRALRAWLLAILFAASLPAAAQPAEQAPARAQLPVVAAGGCATPAAVVEGVRRRSARIEFSGLGDATAAQLRVAIQPDPRGGATAELVVQWPDGRHAERRLAAASCGDALEAVTLLIALMLDPTAPAPASVPTTEHGRERRAERNPRRAPDASVNAPEAPVEPAEAADTTAEAKGAAATPAETPAEPPVSAPAPTAAAVPSVSAPENPAPEPLDDGAQHPLAFEQLAFGASAELVSGPAPELMPGIGLSALVGLRGIGLFAPALMLRASHVLRDGLSEPGGVAAFELDTLQLALCAVQLRAAPFSARACIAGSIGSLSASGSASYSPQSEARLWADLGAALRFALDLSGPLQVQAGLGAAVVLRRYRFAFSPDVFYDVAPLRLGADLGLGLRFP